MRVENVKGAVWTVDDLEYCRRRPLKVNGTSTTSTSQSPLSNSSQSSFKPTQSGDLSADFHDDYDNSIHQYSGDAKSNYLSPNYSSRTGKSESEYGSDEDEASGNEQEDTAAFYYNSRRKASDDTAAAHSLKQSKSKRVCLSPSQF